MAGNKRSFVRRAFPEWRIAVVPRPGKGSIAGFTSPAQAFARRVAAVSLEFPSSPRALIPDGRGAMNRRLPGRDDFRWSWDYLGILSPRSGREVGWFECNTSSKRR